VDVNVSAIDSVLRRAVNERWAPAAVAIVVGPEEINYLGAYGRADTDTQAPITPDAIFRVASFTKAAVAIGALRLIEEGQLSLETPVGDILPAFDRLRVLEGFDGDTPRLRPPASRATIRHLMTHTSGLTYDTFNEGLTRYCSTTGTPMPGAGLKACFRAPMVFDPGTAWAYGMSTDWLGQVIEEVSGERLDEHLRRILFDPLGLNDLTFTPDAAQRQRLVPVQQRASDGEFSRLEFEYPEQPEFYSGGHGLYASAAAFARVQQVLLNGGEFHGIRFLRPESVERMTSPQLGGLGIRPLHSTRLDFSYDLGLGPNVTWGLDTLLTVEGQPGMRPTGSFGWCGTFNTFYWIDPRNRLAAALYMQYLPFFDPGALTFAREFELAVYSR
jgi:methyl acetate hydrolase